MTDFAFDSKHIQT